MVQKISGVAWYRREDYPRLRQLFRHPDDMPDTYDEWLAKATAHCQLQEAQGIQVHRLQVNPDAFTQWCAGQHLNVGKDALHRWGNAQLHAIAQGRRTG